MVNSRSPAAAVTELQMSDRRAASTRRHPTLPSQEPRGASRSYFAHDALEAPHSTAWYASAAFFLSQAAQSALARLSESHRKPSCPLPLVLTRAPLSGFAFGAIRRGVSRER